MLFKSFYSFFIMKTIYTANLIIQKKGKFLLVKRASGDEVNLWSLPGGTKENDEKIEDTLKREIKEELGLNIKESTLFKSYNNIFKDKIVISHYFTINNIDQNIVLNKEELSDCKFFSFKDIPRDLAYKQNIVLNEFIDSQKD